MNFACRAALFAAMLVLASSSAMSEPRLLRLSAAEQLAYLTVPVEQLLRQAYRRLDIQIEITPMPLARGLVESNAGRYDGDLARVEQIQEQHPNLVRVPTPVGRIAMAPYVLLTSAVDLSSWDAVRASRLRIGVRAGSRVSISGMGHAAVTTAPSTAALFQMLALHRIDVAIAPQGGLKATLDPFPSEMREQLKEVRELAPIEFLPLYHFLHKKNGDLVAPLDRQIQAAIRAAAGARQQRVGGPGTAP